MGKIYEQLSIEERTKIQMQLEDGCHASDDCLGVESFAIDDFSGTSSKQLGAAEGATVVLGVHQWLADTVPKPRTSGPAPARSSRVGSDACSQGTRCGSRSWNICNGATRPSRFLAH